MRFPLETEVMRVLAKHPNLAIALGSDKKIKSVLTGIIEAERQKMIESIKQKITLGLDSPEELDAHIETSIDLSHIQIQFNLTDNEVYILKRQSVKETLLSLVKMSLEVTITNMIDTESNCSCENCSCEKSNTTVDKDGKLCE